MFVCKKELLHSGRVPGGPFSSSYWRHRESLIHWSSDPGAGRTPRCFHAYYFHPHCGKSPAHTHFARLPGVGATDRRGNADNIKNKGKKRENKHTLFPVWICFLLWRDFKEVRWFVLLGILDTCTGEKGDTYSTLQSCESSFPWSFFF